MELIIEMGIIKNGTMVKFKKYERNSNFPYLYTEIILQAR